MFVRHSIVKVVFLCLFLTSIFTNTSLAENNISASHHSEAVSYVHDATQALSSISPTVFNPQVEITSILHSVMNSSWDLSSALHSVNVGNLTHDVTLNVGNHNVEISGNQFVTPAEAIAISQVLSSNHQALVLDAVGKAVNGSFNTANLGGVVSNLELPANVTLIDNGKSLILTGNLANYGDIVFSGNGNLQASNILNEGNAQISANGGLGITANTVINEGGLYGANGVNINTPVFYNAGIIEAGLGNINIASVDTLVITATTNSVFEANAGNINIEVMAKSLNNGMNLAYGNYLSKALNLNAGFGYIQGAVENTTGLINLNANSAHLAAASADMVLGNANVHGDPTFVNTTGSITLNGTLSSNGNNIAIIANGNINVANGITSLITTQGQITSAGNLVMIAGLGSNIGYSGSNITNVVPGIAIGSTQSVTVNLNASSGNSGGNIDLLTGNTLGNYQNVINTQGSGNNGNGGTITLVALSNGNTGGDIITGNSSTQLSISSGGALGGSNGNILLIADAYSGTALSLGILSSAGPNSIGGDISIYNAAPTIGTIKFDSTGSITSGAITPDISAMHNANIGLYGTIVSGNSITIETNSSIYLNASIAAGNYNGTQSVSLFAGQNIIYSSPAEFITAGTVNFTTNNGNIGSTTYNALVNASNINISYSGNAYINDMASITNLGNATLVSLLSLTANGTINTTGTITANTINLTSGNNGNINVDSALGTLNISNIAISTNGTGYILTGTNGTIQGVIQGQNVNLTSPNGEIGFNGNGLITQANNITFNAGLSVGINNNTASVAVNTSNSQANVYVENTGNLTGTGIITAPVIGLYSFSGTAGIGTATNLMQITAHNIGLGSFSTGGSVYVNDTYTGTTTLQASQAGYILKLNTGGALSIYAQIENNGQFTTGSISAQIMAIQTFGGYGIYNAALLQSNDFIFLTASQNGFIEEPSSGANMTAPNISLVSGGGAIGNGGTLPLNSAKVSASTQGAGNFVSITDSATNSGIVGGQSGSNFNFYSAGSLNVFGSIATGAGSNANGGNISLIANGIVNIGTTSAVNLTTNNGSIIVLNSDVASGAINIFANSLIFASSTTASNGYVVLNIGNYSQTNTTNPNPANIQVITSGGANVYFGANSIKANSSGNLLYADGQAIVFNTGSLPASAITLGGNVHITADPPVYLTNSGVLNQNGLTTNPNEIINNPNSLFGSLNNYAFDNSANFNSLTHSNLRPDFDTSVNNQVVDISYQHPSSYVGLDHSINFLNTNLVNSVVTLSQSGLIKAKHKMEIKFGLNNHVSVQLKAGAIILAIVKGNLVSVYNLHDNAQNSVLVKAVGLPKSISLNPGMHLSIIKASSIADFADVNPFPAIGYRGLKISQIGNYCLYLADFSLPSTIKSIKVLATLFNRSGSSREDIAVARQLLKTATVINYATANLGGYQQMTRVQDRLTAFK